MSLLAARSACCSGSGEAELLSLEDDSDWDEEEEESLPDAGDVAGLTVAAFLAIVEQQGTKRIEPNGTCAANSVDREAKKSLAVKNPLRLLGPNHLAGSVYRYLSSPFSLSPHACFEVPISLSRMAAPLSSKQESRLIIYLDERLLTLSRNFEARHSPNAALPTITSYLAVVSRPLVPFWLIR